MGLITCLSFFLAPSSFAMRWYIDWDGPLRSVLNVADLLTLMSSL